jgi:hypothetical protein
MTLESFFIAVGLGLGIFCYGLYLIHTGKKDIEQSKRHKL